MIKNICVIGAGTMGHSIAIMFGRHGYKVNLQESSQSVLDTVMGRIKSAIEFMVKCDYLPESKLKETLERITLFADLEEAVCDADYVIEAIPEQLELKQELFHKLDLLCPQHTILSSNTSSLPLKKMMELVSDNRKKKMMVCHMYNPAHLVPIVELSFFGNMDKDDYNLVNQLYKNVGKCPVKVLKDIPGLVANRMFQAMAREIIFLLEIGAASAEDLDIALKAGPAFRSATTGLMETMDMGGLDVWCTVMDSIYKELSSSDRASDIIRAKVQQGKLGIKTGEGFFKYDHVDSVVDDFYKRLIIQLKASENYLI